ncbi:MULTISPECIES: MarR family transcriptional regulator [unclassified Streptomyces]|uniref:MarR family transcriptional regulator n=1 Tax=unclassified Streptomyces TaxID=2593676 RepID=UPI001661D2FE|nr:MULTISPECIES: helix-turn-helix domain-containing protein [unclassified Streptomyces]MBD0843071.1 MarR family transcriptional regulator [Streptomyces sp. TRM68416]
MSGYHHLAPALAACGRDGFTGALRVTGTPGGTVHFRNGLVVAAESSGAPGPEALLLRSGRISGEQWAELVRESGGAHWPAAELVTHGYAGDVQLRVVCVMALHDAVFAICAGSVEDCRRLADTEPVAPLPVGEPAGQVLQDTTRKLAALEALDHAVHPERERLLAAADPDGPFTPLQRDLLGHADGRSTARDLAFRTGRSVYAVTVEVARMLGEGLLERVVAPEPVRIHTPPDGHGVRPRTPPPPGPPPTPHGPDVLPRRQPGASGIAEVLEPEDSGTSWKWFFRLRNGTAR